jgi:hypothetical protein
MSIVVPGRQESKHGCEGDVGRVDRKIDAEWEVRRGALVADWAPTDVSGILVTKRNRRFALPCPFRSICVPSDLCVRSWRGDEGG